MSYKEFLIAYHLRDTRGARSYYKEYRRKIIKENIKYTIIGLFIASMCIIIGIGIAYVMVGGVR